ncbi:Uncharacterized protein dnm_053340 [Desulfonema magnum]|uniref:Uncharacterized protein n=1 Tax=Desulfonema magnum TaxID=45655 RepID=A0A975BP44_9BACT|nr:Uncharacterized protein dnm_053340 [Desulfonema magnum]
MKQRFHTNLSYIQIKLFVSSFQFPVSSFKFPVSNFKT